MFRRNRSTFALLLLVLSTGCGYGLVGRTSNLPEDIEEIFIQPLDNQTLRQQVDQELTRAISDEFLRRQGFKVVNSKAAADAVLSGTVASFSVRPVTFGATEGRGREYEVQIRARMEFRRTDNDEVLWKQDFYQFRDSYELQQDTVDFIDLEDVAIQEIAGSFAQTLVIDILEGF